MSISELRTLRFVVTVDTDASDEALIAGITGRDAGWPDSYPLRRSTPDGVTALRDLLYEAICEEDFFIDMFPPSTSLSIAYLDSEGDPIQSNEGAV